MICSVRSSGSSSLVPSDSQFPPVFGSVSFPVHGRCRLNVPYCAKVRVVQGNWADGKQCGPKFPASFLASWRTCWPWRDSGRASHLCPLSRAVVRRAAGMAVTWDRTCTCQEGVDALGGIEIAWRSGHHDRSGDEWHACQSCWSWECRNAEARAWRIAESGPGLRTRPACGGASSARQEADRSTVCSRAGYALRVRALDRFPWTRQLGEMVTQPRSAEARTRQDWEPGLRLARAGRLRRSKKLTEKWQLKLPDLLDSNLWTVRTDRLKEHFQPFRNGGSPGQEDRLLALRCGLAMWSRAAPPQRRAHALQAAAVPAEPSACLGRARGGTARRNRPRKSIWVRVLRIGLNRLGASPRRSTGTRSHVLLKVEIEFCRQKP